MSEVVMTELVRQMNTNAMTRPGRNPRLSRAIARVEERTLIRLANVQGHALVQNEKLHEIDRLTREAVSGQAMLSHWAATLAKGDAFLTDELKFFTDLARIGKGEIVADTVSDFCQEGRR
jgi:hypothetical protein